MYELSANEISQISGGLRPIFLGNGSYNRCVAGFTLGGALLGSAIGFGTTGPAGGISGFGIGGTLGATAGAYFCE